MENGKSLRNARNGMCPTKTWIPQLIDKDGVVKVNREDVLEVAASFYENLFTSTLSHAERESICPDLSDDTEIDEISMLELQIALKTMKKSKATGSDDIPSDLLKVCVIIGLERLKSVFNDILRTEDIPEEWYNSTITLIYKNHGDRRNIKNYRPIMITSHLYKLFMKILLNRLT